jgi:hypothetical protein
MNQKEKVQLNLLLPVCQRDRLRKLAAEKNLKDPSRVTSAATIARKIICDYLDNQESQNKNTKVLLKY